ncbi:hypothetical protein M758_UG205900 [Ceratodon purpureus]|nr:hypothetical protein M758_UG205900 [Ceratodon purpureus]
MTPKRPAMSVGNGFTKFQDDMSITMGSYLIFKAVDNKSLVVTVVPPCKMLRSFSKIVRKSNTIPYNSSRLGPLATTQVQSTVTHTPKQTIYSFTQGWSNFCVTNQLKVGDIILFTEVESHTFDVTVQ